MFTVQTIHQSMAHTQILHQPIQMQQANSQSQPSSQDTQQTQTTQSSAHPVQAIHIQVHPVAHQQTTVAKTKKPKVERAPRKPKKEKLPKKPKIKKEKAMKRKTTREIIDKQGRGIVFNVYMFLKAMHMRQQCQQPVKFAKTQELTAQACGIGKRTVQRIIKEGRISLETNEQPIFESPVKTRNVTKRVTNLDDMDCFILRRTIHDFYDQKQFPTLRQLMPVISGKINFQGSYNSLRRILKDLGFCYRKAADGRKFLMERADIIAARVKFLRTMHELRKSDRRPIFYVGESSVDPNYTLSLAHLTKKKNTANKIPKAKQPQIVVCHVGSAKTGFITQCKLVFQPKTKNSEGEVNEMNTAVFKTWFIKFLHNLSEASIIVMDNSPHHCRLLDLVPGAGSRKSDIVEWLWRYGIPHDTKQTRAELLSLVKMHQPKSKSYELDTIASEKGHTVVRLPPFHNQYNPIEMVWAQVKAEIAERNTTLKVTDVASLVHQVLDNTSREVWEQSVRHAEQLQEADFKKELYRDQNLESFVVNLQSDSESDAGDSDDEDHENENEKLIHVL